MQIIASLHNDNKYTGNHYTLFPKVRNYPQLPVNRCHDLKDVDV